MPQTLGALRDDLPSDVRTLPRADDPASADIKGVTAVTAPTVQDAAVRLDRLVELAGRGLAHGCDTPMTRTDTG